MEEFQPGREDEEPADALGADEQVRDIARRECQPGILERLLRAWTSGDLPQPALHAALWVYAAMTSPLLTGLQGIFFINAKQGSAKSAPYLVPDLWFGEEALKGAGRRRRTGNRRTRRPRP
jgi:hypothetical protein